MVRNLLVLSLLPLLLVAACGQDAPVPTEKPAESPGTPPAAEIGATKTVVLDVFGMGGDCCPDAVRSQIMKVPGVVAAEVSLETGKATCTVGEKVDPKVLAAAVGDGYSAKVFEE